MRTRRCTIDSSCVIALDHLKLLPSLSWLFSQVLVPKAVRDELSKRRATKDRLHSLFDQYALFRRCDDYEKGAVAFLLAERSLQGVQDRGEVEAVVQASQFGATVIIDDTWGRKLAARNDLNCHGTLWILDRFHELGLMSSSTLRSNLLTLRKRGIRLPAKNVNALLTKVGEEPL
jgi:predicted nucleic acid-binding protein